MRNYSIPYYESINAFLEATHVKHRTKNSNFYCMRLEEHIGDIYMPPFKRGFYFMALLETQGNTQISFNEAEQKNIPTYYLVLQSPNLTYSFYRDSDTKGYLVYFKLDAFDFFKPEFQKEFLFLMLYKLILKQLVYHNIKVYPLNLKEFSKDMKILIVHII